MDARGFADGRFAITGLGLPPCERLAELRNDPTKRVGLAAWLDGYVTARNRLTADTFDVVSWESSDLLTQLLGENCARLPDSRFALVLEAILDKMMPARLAESSPLVSAIVGDDGLMMYQDALARVQQSLAAQGYYEGTASGVIDEATSNALREFQRGADLPLTGLPDQLTL